MQIETIPHEKIKLETGSFDIARGVHMSGSRFSVLRGSIAALHRALGNYMLDFHTLRGYEEINPPLLLNEQAVKNTGHSPNFENEMYRTQTGHYLVPTGELPLVNMVADTIIETKNFPLRYCALTPCFRREAGAAGRDTRGIMRQHQFYKVELVSIVLPAYSDLELRLMIFNLELLLNNLGLETSQVLLEEQDLGFAAQKTVDIEVKMGNGEFREISSCSNCGEYQAKLAKIRHKVMGAKGTNPVHTLNGSGVAIGRALAAYVERWQQPEGIMVVPVLQKYLHGKTLLV